VLRSCSGKVRCLLADAYRGLSPARPPPSDQGVCALLAHERRSCRLSGSQSGSQAQNAVARYGDTLCPTPHRGMRHHRISVVPQGPVNADLIAETRAAIAEASDALGRAQRALDLLDLGPAPLSTPEPPPRLLTVSQAAKALSLGVSTVHELIRSGALVSVKIGAARRVPVEALDTFLKARAAS
jgi:excisionase family DNA binding protein